MRSSIRSAALIVCLVASTAPSVGAAPDPDPNAMCGGEAPAVTACTTGVHQTQAFGFLGNTTFSVAGYRGTLVGRLDWTSAGEPRSGRAVIRCDYSGDPFIDAYIGDCSASGTWPRQNAAATITHTCNSYRFDTNDAGGSGHWRCRFGHL